MDGVSGVGTGPSPAAAQPASSDRDNVSAVKQAMDLIFGFISTKPPCEVYITIPFDMGGINYKWVTKQGVVLRKDCKKKEY